MIKAHPLVRERRRWQGDGVAWPLATLTLLLLAAVLVAPRWLALRDTLRYGYPRTMHLTAHVGHEEQPGRPTQFIAMNLDRQVVVFEIPGGDVAKTRTLTGPYLFGANEDLTPVHITLALINPDKEPDLVVSIKNEEIIYINAGQEFRLINDAERAALEGK